MIFCIHSFILIFFIATTSLSSIATCGFALFVSVLIFELSCWCCFSWKLLDTVNSRLADTSLLRTPHYYWQELKSRGIRITENNSCYYGLSITDTKLWSQLMVSTITRVDYTKGASSVVITYGWLVQNRVRLHQKPPKSCWYVVFTRLDTALGIQQSW